MKFPIQRKEGMETVTSLFILLISVLLIFNVLIIVDPHNTGDGQLLKIRKFQARSLGETLVLYTAKNEWNMEPLNMTAGSSGVAYYWDGVSLACSSDPFPDIFNNIEKVMKTTPDGLSSLLYLSCPGSDEPEVSGEYTTWNFNTVSGTVITIFLSLHIDSMVFGGAG